MASVEHTLLFLLTAKVDSAFGSGFASAKSALADLQNQINANKKTIGKIDEYDRAVAALNKMTSASGTSASRLDAQRDKVAKLGDELQDLNVDLNNTEAARRALVQSSNELGRQQEEIAAYRNQVYDLSLKYMAVSEAANAALKPISAIVDAMETSVQTAAGFEYTMSAVSAIAGSSAEEATSLAAVAKEMGATTVFTAQESAEALQTMALAGWDTQDMLAGLPAVVKLAAASGEDLTEVTSILSDGMHAFGLEGETSTRKFADVLVKAATSSNTTVGLLGESLSYVETSAGNLGYSIEDVSIALAAMANNALKGGVSGSALNTMLTRMSGANATAKKEMDALGLSMYDTATGEAKPLLQFLEELRVAFQGFGEDSQSAQIAAYKLAGQRGMRGLLALVNSSDEAWKSLVDDVYSYSGAADTIANQRLDNFTGKVTLLESAQEALQTTVGQAVLPLATDGAEILTTLTQKINDIAAASPGLVTSVTTAAYGFQGLLSVVAEASGGLANFAIIANTVNPEWTAKILGSLSQIGLIAGAGAAILILGASLTAAALAAREADPAFDDITSRLNSADEAASRAREEFEKQSSVFQDNRDAADYLIDELDSLLRIEAEHGGQESAIKEKVDELNAALPGLALEYSGVGTEISKTTDEIRAFNDAMSPEEVQTRKDYLNTLQGQVETYRRILDAANEEQEEKREDDPGYDAIARMIEANPNAAASIGAFGQGAAYLGAYGEYASDAAKAQDDLNNATEDYEEILESLRQNAREKIDQYGLEGIDEDEYLDYETQIYGLVEAYGEAYQAAYDSVTGQFSLWDEAGQYLNTFGESYQNAFDQAKKSYEGLYSIWDEVSFTAPEDRITFEGLQQNQIDQNTFWTTYRDNLQVLKDSGIDFSDIWGQLTEGSMDAYDAVQAMVDALNSGDTTGLQKYIDGFQAEKEAINDVAEMAAAAEAVTLEQLQKNVDSQMAAWTEYENNLKTLSANFDLTPLNGQFDGSASAMGLAAALMQEYANGGEEAVQRFIDSTATLNEKEQSVSSALGYLDEEVQQVVQNMADALGPEAFEGKRGVLEAVAADVLAGWVQGIEDGEDMAAPLQSGITTAMEAAATAAGTHSPSTITNKIGQNVDQGFIDGVMALQGEIMNTMSLTASQAVTTFGSSLGYSTFYSYGVSAMQGAIAGIKAMQASLVAAAAAAGTAAANAYKSAQSINSPSRLFEWFSEMDMLGAIQGIERNQDEVSAAMAAAAQENAAAYLSGGTASSITGVTAVDPLLMQAMNSMSAQTAQPMQAMMAPVASGGGATIQLTYSPQINAGSGTDAAGIRRILDEDKDSLVDFLDDWANEREINQRRGTY